MFVRPTCGRLIHGQTRTFLSNLQSLRKVNLRILRLWFMMVNVRFAHCHPLLFRMVALFSAVVILTSATASGLHPVAASVSEAVRQYLRKPQGPYTQVPTRPYLGKRPGRDPQGRGGVWTAEMRRAAKDASAVTVLSEEETGYQVQGHTLAVAAEPGARTRGKEVAAGSTPVTGIGSRRSL